jgi:hypothetical protein
VLAASSSEPPSEPGVGVPSSRSLATASREAVSDYLPPWTRTSEDLLVAERQATGAAKSMNTGGAAKMPFGTIR